MNISFLISLAYQLGFLPATTLGVPVMNSDTPNAWVPHQIPIIVVTITSIQLLVGVKKIKNLK